MTTVPDKQYHTLWSHKITHFTYLCGKWVCTKQNKQLLIGHVHTVKFQE